MHVVTAGTAFIDIDVYGSAVALAELLRLQGEQALAASSAPFNSSVPSSLRNLDVQFETNYKPSPDDVFSIVDLSDPEYFDFNANINNVVMIVDHHPQFELFWEERLGDNAHIEFIGAACTQVYELWQQAGLQNKMSQATAKLLACGILDNTLNLKAKITTERDKTAYAFLAKHAGLPADWPAQYFKECQTYIAHDLHHAVISDTKTAKYPLHPNKITAGQLALWDAKMFINDNQSSIAQILGKENSSWYMNFIDIKTGRSLFLCQDKDTQTWLAVLLGLTFKDNLATADRLWLRKEIMKQAIEKEQR